MRSLSIIVPTLNEGAQIAEALRAASPSATPNPLFVAIADRMLGTMNYRFGEGAREAFEHRTHIGRGDFGKQRVLQQPLQPLDFLMVLPQLQQQVLIGQAPGQQATEHGAVQGKHADIGQRLGFVQTWQAGR